MMDMMKMMGKLKEVQENMKVAQESLKEITATGEAGAGMVTATVNGQKEVISIEMDDTLLTPGDKEMLADLVIAAINNALKEIDTKAKEHMKKATEGMIPNIPGFDLNNMV